MGFVSVHAEESDAFSRPAEVVGQTGKSSSQFEIVLFSENLGKDSGLVFC